MKHVISSPAFRRTVALAAGLAAVWAVAAGFRPQTTFHLAPILITLAVPYLAVATLRGEPGWFSSVVGAVGMSLGATIVLGIAGRLAGPSLLPFGGAVMEAFVFTFLAAVVALGIGLGSQTTVWSGVRPR